MITVTFNIRKNFLLFAAIFFLYEPDLTAQTIVTGGNVSGTWTKAASPYLVQGSIQIPNGSTLTIEAGANIIFQGTYKLLINGRLLAIGTVTDSIIFQANNTTTGWRGIRFENTPLSNDSSILVNCILQNGITVGGSGTADTKGGALYFENFSKARISGCRISDNNSSDLGGAFFCLNSNLIISDNKINNNFGGTSGGGIACDGSSPLVEGNIITNNQSQNGGGLFLFNNSSPLISNNTISYNSVQGNGGGIRAVSGCAPIIRKNKIIYNKTTQDFGSGGGIAVEQSNAVVEYNFICNNYSGSQGGGVVAGNGTISNNVIANNKAKSIAGGIFFSSSPTEVINNTIVKNVSTNGGGIYCFNGASPSIYNTIIWDNAATSKGHQVFLAQENCDPNFYYCDIKGGPGDFELNNNFYTGIYQNNINTDPRFLAPSADTGDIYDGLLANWNLQSSSPCINSGKPTGIYPAVDIAGNQRVIGIIDMGAYESMIITSTSNLLAQSRRPYFTISPNPAKEHIILSFTKPVKLLEITITDLSGRIIYASVLKRYNISIQNLPVNGIKPGYYYLSTITQEGQFVKPLIINQ
jgi:Right handed beta helix region/Secretion system C-terminal sorting domain